MNTITKELLEATQQDLLMIWEPIETAHREKKRQVFNPLMDLLEQYYDETLLDSNGDIVKGTNVIQKGKKLYCVTGRNMQFILGRFMMNPHVFAKPLKNGLEIDHGKKELELSPRELVYYTIVKDFYANQPNVIK